jgi:glycogen debranching enzyme
LPVAPDRARALTHGAHRVLAANWRQGRRRDGLPYAYTCPATPRYRHQWLWDSCFHAIVWRRFDPLRAREELRTLLRAGRADGFVPHTAFRGWPAGWRRAPFYATESVRGPTATATIGPPFVALAWELVADGDRDFVDEGLGPLRAHLDWLAHERDIDGDGLLTIITPDESGLDDAPKFDPVYRGMAHDRPGHFRLVHRCRRLGYDAKAIAARHDEHVEEVLVNVAYALSLRAYARLSGDFEFVARAEHTEAALLERCLDPKTGLFFDLAGGDERLVPIATWSALAPLALRDLPEDVRRRLVEEHLLDARRFAAPVGIPSVSRDEPTFNARFDRWRTWRGPSWMNTAWLLVPALRELGYDAAADRIVTSLAAAVERHGFREYYDPLRGRGLAARAFGWSTLLVELVHEP